MTSKVIGLTGGIGCGKSVVAEIMQSYGDIVVDADAIGRSVVEGDPKVLQRIVDAFGREFLSAEGTLDRKKLGDFVFASAERRDMLNGIVHPELWRQCLDRISAARAKSAPLIIVDAALVYEVGLEKEFEGVLVVTAEPELRIARVMKRDGLSAEAVRIRIAAQMSMEEKERRATWLIRNNGTIDELKMKVRAVRSLIVSEPT